jgi:hypothetical protein
VTTNPTITTSQPPRLLRGKARVRELAPEAEAERKIEEAALLADLNHQASYAEKLLIENAAALAVRARRLRRYGRNKEAGAVIMLLVRTLGKLGVRPGEAKADPTKALDELFGRITADSGAAP